MTGIEFLGIWALFNRFGSLKAWSLAEVAFFYGFVQMIFAFSDALGRGFDIIGNIIRDGRFDSLLLKPRPVGLQVLGYEFTMRRVGRFTQGLIVFVYALTIIKPEWNLYHISLLVMSFIGGVSMYMGIYHIQGAFTFRSVESLEVMNIFTYGTVYAAQYPLTIYPGALFKFLSYVIPLSSFAYFPLAGVLERENVPGASLPDGVRLMIPLAGVLFLFLGIAVWRRGMRYYASTGS